jgi:apolipoprotein N-acyltransferase
MGMELAQGHMLTGFTMGNLGSTQQGWIELIQISDLAGVYGVGFVVMWVAACAARMIPVDGQSFTWRPLVPAVALVALVLLYGHLRVTQPSGKVDARIALIQGSIDTVLNPEPGSRERMHAHYHEITQAAVRRFGSSGIDLIVWPETVFFGPLVTSVAGSSDQLPQELISEQEQAYRQSLQACDRVVRELMAIMTSQFDAPMLVGINRKNLVPRGIENYNSAAYVDRTGHLVGCYDKMHRVVFGEYIPLADELSWLIELTPLNSLNITLDAGSRPVTFELDGLWIAPNICYESVLPHLIRRQINTLARQGREPDILVNLTNDGWFWGSSELDMHLACGVFRAVECRKPFLIAANTGFSAWIDADGRIRARGPRRATDSLLAEVSVDGRTSWYLRHGDIPAGICLLACAVFAAVGCWERWRKRRTAGP